MLLFVKFVISTAGTLLAYSLYQLARFVITQINSPLCDLPGPKSSHWFYGNVKELSEGEAVIPEQWVAKYGPTMKFTGLAKTQRLFTADTKAINYILMNDDGFQKPERARVALARLLGQGVLVAEGDMHRKQRKIMNPAFGHAQIRELTEIFVEKSMQLRDVWLSDVAKNNADGFARIDVLAGLSQMTLDVIGLAGFNYDFGALNTDRSPNELSEAFSTIFSSSPQFSLWGVIKILLPPSISRFIKSKHDIEISQALDSMQRIGKELLRKSKEAVMAAASGEKNGIRGRDLLSLLIRANTAADLPDEQRLNDADVLAQVPTFLVAGHETTSTATAWALFALTQNTRVKAKLCIELLSVSTNNPTMDELNALPYLDSVVRETLRVHTPVAFTSRVAMKDEELPLNTPYMDRKGVPHDRIKIGKGNTLLIPIMVLNKSKLLWGEDAMEFKPERWDLLPEAVSTIPGVWGNMLTFMGGPHACIGYRFALVEMKVLLFTLIRAFEFELAVPAEDIIRKPSLVDRPAVRTDPEGGTQLPLFVRQYVPL